MKASVDSIYSAIKVLMNLNLIEENRLKEFPFSVVVSLTTNGKKTEARRD